MSKPKHNIAVLLAEIASLRLKVEELERERDEAERKRDYAIRWANSSVDSVKEGLAALEDQNRAGECGCSAVGALAFMAVRPSDAGETK